MEHVALWGERSYKVCETIKAETRATIRQQGFNWRCWLRPEAAKMHGVKLMFKEKSLSFGRKSGANPPALLKKKTYPNLTDLAYTGVAG